MLSFDLLSEPWLPVLDAGSDLRGTPGAPTTPREIGLREALLRAHEIREVAADSPLETIALDRLLLALALDVYQSAPDPDAWHALWRAGRFDPAPLDAYLDCWVDRFNLLHPIHPFFQRTTTDPSMDGKSPSPLARLFHARASGNNATLFAHDLDADPRPVSLAVAARAIVAAQAAALGGGVSQPFNLSHGPLVGRAQLWIRGRSLFEALLLNAPPTTKARMGATPDDAPSWRRDLAPTHVYSRRRHDGLLDVLTWPSRRLTLVADGDHATGVYVTQGDKLEPQPTDDPLAAHVTSKDKGVFPLGLRAGRAVWRDASVLFDTRPGSGRHAPHTFEWAASLAVAEGGDPALPRVLREQGVDVFGLVNDQAKPELWRHERLPLHVEILADSSRQEDLHAALDIAANGWSQKSGPCLSSAVRTMAQFALDPPPAGDDARSSADPKAVSALVQSLAAEPRYWALLEPRFFGLLGEIATAVSHAAREAVLARWAGVVARAALEAYDTATSSFRRDARDLRAWAEGRARLPPIPDDTAVGVSDAPDAALAPVDPPGPSPQTTLFHDGY